MSALKPNYNLSPTQLSPVVHVNQGGPGVNMFRFGLVPFWAKDVAAASKYSLINAKGEEIESKRSYADPFKKRRCIIPLSGFYEWKNETGQPKRPFAIQRKDKTIMSVAGVWEHWIDKADAKKEIYSFSIITTSANSFMEKIHHRMPVILEAKDEEAWLDPDLQDVERLKKFLVPCPSTWLSSFEVSTLVNSPRNNRPEVLNPV